MESTNYIKNKNRIKNTLQSISKLKNWVLVQDKKSDRWYIYDKGDLLFKIAGNISEELITLTFIFPFIYEMQIATEIFLRQSFMDWDFRQLFNKISINKKDDMFYLVKKVSIKKNRANLQLYLLDQINETLSDLERLSQAVKKRIEIVSQVKLN